MWWLLKLRKAVGSCLSGVLISCLCLASNTAAQVPGSNGVRLGKFRLSPTLRAAAGYNTNPLFGNQSEEADFLFMLNPGIELSAIRQRLLFHTGYDYNRIQYFETDIQNSDNHHAKLALEYKSYRWGLELSNQFDLTSDPADAEILERLDRTENKANATFSIFSPSKDAEVRLQYSNYIRTFDGELQSLNSLQNLLMVTSVVNITSFIRFLPKSLLNLAFEYSDYQFPDADNGDRSDGNGLNFLAGINSRISSKLSSLVELGYNHLDFDAGPGSDAITSKAEFSYGWQRYNFSLSYVRKTQTAFFTNFYDLNSLQYQFSWKTISERWRLNSSGNLDWLDYSGPNGVASGDNRSDTVLRHAIKVQYRLTKRVDLYTSYDVSQRSSNATNPLTGNASSDFAQQIWMLGCFIYY